MKKSQGIRWTLAASLIAGAWIYGCGGGGATVAATRSYLGTQAPGDVWTWDIKTDSFSAKNETTNTTYEGTSEKLSNGFLKLTLTGTNSLSAAAGESAYAIELPNTAVIVKPAGADTQPPIVCAALGGNPAGPTASFNYVAIPKHNYTSNEMAYGWVTFNVNGNDLTGTSNDYKMDDTPQNNGPVHLTGDNGRLSQFDQNGNLQATAGISPTGVCAFDYGPGNGGVIGVAQPAADLDLADLASKSYNGFLVETGHTQAVTCAPNPANGRLMGHGYASGAAIETNTFDDGGGLYFNFVSQPQHGLIRVHLEFVNGGGEDLVMAASQIGGKYVLYAFGWNASQSSAYNVVLVEK